MDSITQAALGATLGGAVLGRPLGRKALIGGAVLGTLPDMDVLLDHGSAIADFTYHRGFSHSLFVLAALAIILAWLLRRIGPGTISLSRWWWFCALPLITHPLLDSFTTYGTQLLWPLQSPPVAWNTIFIIDPLYTLPLLVATLITLGREAFFWFGIDQSKEVRARLAAFWQRDDRFETHCEVMLGDSRGNTRSFTLYPLPHPSPLNQTWYRRFPGLLKQRLEQVGLNLDTVTR